MITQLVPSRAGHNAQSRQGAFTLIELLVVISVVAVLISILLPALQQARETARDMDCRTRARSLAMAWQVYAHDHAGISPICFRGWASSSDQWWVNLLDTYVGTDWNGAYDDTNSFFTRMFCPSSPGPRENALFANPENAMWIGMNQFINPTPFNGFSEIAPPRLSSVVDPSRTVLFLDSTSSFTGPASGTGMALSNSRFTYRHGGYRMSNFAMADGSAQGAVTLDPEGQDLDQTPGLTDAIPPQEFRWQVPANEPAYPDWWTADIDALGYPNWPY